LRRVVPVLERVGREMLVSIDTSKAEVARAALDLGAAIVNDVTGFRDPEMVRAVAESGAGAVVMHMRGSPRTMQVAPVYADVVGEVREFFLQRREALLASGLDPMSIAFDPGIGFGKTVEHNLALLRGLRGLRVGGHPLVLGVSRKSFIGRVLGEEGMGAREWPTVALTAYGREMGAEIFRVHDVGPNVQAMRMIEAIAGVR
jgi:dihydropteroate synthase